MPVVFWATVFIQQHLAHYTVGANRTNKCKTNKTNAYEPHRDKTNKMTVRPAKTQISLGIRPVWSVSSLSARRELRSLAAHWAHSEDSDQTGRMSRLIWVFAWRTATLLVLSWGENLVLVIYFTYPVNPFIARWGISSMRPRGIFRLCTTTKLKMDKSTKSSQQTVLFQTKYIKIDIF